MKEGFSGTKAADRFSKEGFTLVEIVVTVCVLAFGCLAVIHMHTASLRGSNYSDNLSAAVFLAESEMERIKALDYSALKDLAALGEVSQTRLNRMGEACPSPVCGLYPFDRKVNFYPDVPTSFSDHVEIEVSWRDNSGSHRVFYSGAVTSMVFN